MRHLFLNALRMWHNIHIIRLDIGGILGKLLSFCNLCGEPITQQLPSWRPAAVLQQGVGHL